MPSNPNDVVNMMQAVIASGFAAAAVLSLLFRISR